MTVAHELSCSCGNMGWSVTYEAPGRHIACYCLDCQSYAHELGRADMLTDEGGTHIFQTVPSEVHFSRGLSDLKMLRLSEDGLFRWYAGCCNTPIANTMKKPDLPFVGMVLPTDEQGFGPVKSRVQTKAAKRDVAADGMIMAGLSVLVRGLWAIGQNRTDSEFFSADRKPVVVPRVLSLAERKAARLAAMR